MGGAAAPSLLGKYGLMSALLGVQPWYTPTLEDYELLAQVGSWLGLAEWMAGRANHLIGTVSGGQDGTTCVLGPVAMGTLAYLPALPLQWYRRASMPPGCWSTATP